MRRTRIQYVPKAHSQVGVRVRGDGHPRLPLDAPLALVHIPAPAPIDDLEVHSRQTFWRAGDGHERCGHG